VKLEWTDFFEISAVRGVFSTGTFHKSMLTAWVEPNGQHNQFVQT